MAWTSTLSKATTPPFKQSCSDMKDAQVCKGRNGDRWGKSAKVAAVNKSSTTYKSLTYYCVRKVTSILPASSTHSMMWQSYDINGASEFSVCMTVSLKNITTFCAHRNEIKSSDECLCDMNKALYADLHVFVEHTI